MKLRQGNVLHLSVILSTEEGGSASVHAGIHPPTPGQTPLGRPPRAATPQQTATTAGGTHPTRMHSCYNFELSTKLFSKPEIGGE